MRKSKKVKFKSLVIKIFFIIIFAIILFIASFLSHGNLVFDVKNPDEIYIDTNKNLIFDERNPIILSNIYYINENQDYSQHNIFNVLSDDEKFFLAYMAKQTAYNLLKNKYVEVIDDDIILNNKSYRNEILSSKFVYDGTEKSQKELIENIKKINLDDYVILNLKNKKYHKLSCQSGRKSAKYKIIKVSSLNETMQPCKSCHLPDNSIVIEEIKNSAINNVKIENDIYTNRNISIFFVDLNKIFRPDNICNEMACKILKQEIDNAEKSIDFAIYGINNQPKILEALIKAYNRGVKIRRVYDYSEKKYYEDNDKLDNIILEFRTDEEYDKTHSAALMHNKYFIFDDKKVWMGSSNISSTDLSGFNANYVVLIENEKIAKKYKQDFEQMYNGIFHKSKKSSNPEFIQIADNLRIKPLFSPQDNIIDNEVIPLIKSAKKYIYAPVFFITHKLIMEELINAHKRGVEVKIINDATNAHTKYTIHKNLRNEGIKVKTENYAGKMHSKVIIIDDKYSIIGSMNFTGSGSSKNDENAIIIDNYDIANFMKSTFIYLWNKIPDKYETFDPKAESKESIGSCYDGIDNDFDSKIDSYDEGCIK